MSVSSLESSPVPLDLPAKYQKIVTEYAKIRAQYGVLKKAIVEEQSNLAEMKETLRLKDQSLRKAEQEIDSLNFRNQQLTKRVTILQDELDAHQNSGKKGKGKSVTKEVSNSIFAEELEKKITENAHLMSLLQEQNEKFENERFTLIQKQDMLEHELHKCKDILVNIEETKLSKLENANKQLLEKLNAKDETLKKLYNDVKVAKGKSLEHGVSLNSDEWNNKLLKLLHCLVVDELLRTMIAFFHNIEIQFKNLIDKSVTVEFSDCVKKTISFLEVFLNSFSSCSVNGLHREETLLGMETFSSSVNSFTIALDELCLYIISCEDEEMRDTLKDIICSIKNHWIDFHSALKVSLASIRSSSDSEECATAIADVFRSLRNSCDYFCSGLVDKFNESVPDQEYGREMKSTISKMGTLSSSVYKKLIENKSILRYLIECRPIKEELRNAELEEKESYQYWREKYETVTAEQSKKIVELEERISRLNEAATSPSIHSCSSTVSPTDVGCKTIESNNVVGTMTGSAALAGSSDNEVAELTKYFNAKINNLVVDRQLAESKVTSYKSECEVLQKRLEHSIDCRQELETSVKRMQSTIDRLQEELTTTSKNYEDQLSSLSEHMANMSDKLAAQQEEIEVLKYQLSETGRKGKSK